MKKYNIKLTLLSDTIIGSGEGAGPIIDSDVIYDDAGIPFIPAKRIKGLLRDSLNEIINYPALKYGQDLLTDLFGDKGIKKGAVEFSNLFINDYQNVYKYLRYLISENKIPLDFIKSYFSNIRSQTTIEDGVAKENSLRTIRVLNKDISFYGEIKLFKEEEKYTKLLSLSCRNLKNMGTKRNRGFGRVSVSLLDNIDLFNHYFKKAEDICIQ